jgi:hypothetical protein
MKTCARCKQNLPNTEFYSNGRGQLKSYCKSCASTRNTTAAAGITPQEYDLFLRFQHGKCAICGCIETGSSRTVRMSIDHDHTTGVVRGLLCHGCNSGIGLFKENIEVMKKAISYLENGGIDLK